MKLPQQNKRKVNSLVLSFLLPFTGMMVLMLISGCEPFGNRTFLYSDAWHQYYPFFLNFREALRSGDSLLYNWDLGMGMDYLGLISYYLASPLNLLSVIVPDVWLLEYFNLLHPIRLGLAGLFFAYFLKEIFRKEDISVAIFGSFYALCAWALGYKWNVMWMDTFALLPLVVLGTIKLLRDKKFILYTVTLFLAVFSNYYIGFFVCIFVFLLFFCYEICRWQGFKRFFLDLCRIALFSLLAIGMTAILELPAFAALQTTQSSVNSFPEGFSTNIISSTQTAAAKEAWRAYTTAKEAVEADLRSLWFTAGEETGIFGLLGFWFASVRASFENGLPGLWFTAIAESIPPLLDGMRQVAGNMGGGIEPSWKEGLPNLYCGVGTIILAFLYLMARDVKLRDKLCAVAMLLFLNVSFIIRQLDYIWHGFHFTNMIPYRFSFLYSFVLLYMAYRAWLVRRKFSGFHIAIAGILAADILAFSNDLTSTVELELGDIVLDIPLYLIYNGVFLILYLGALFYGSYKKKLPEDAEPEEVAANRGRQNQRRANSRLILAGIMLLELCMNLVNYGTTVSFTTISNYPKGTSHAASMIKYMYEREDDNLFFRAETTHSQTLNDDALNGYAGVSAFTSSANVRVTEFMKTLGYGAKNTYNRYCWEEASPVSNLFLNLKYMIERDDRDRESTVFTDLHSYGNVHLLENNAYLPLGFLAESTLAELDFGAGGKVFDFQNALFTSATGLTADVWHKLSGADLDIIGNGVTIKDQPGSGYCSYSDAQSKANIIYSYTADRDGFMCVNVDLPKRNGVTIRVNGNLIYTETTSLAQMMAVCDVVAGDLIEVEMACGAGESGTMTLTAAIMDLDTFRKGYDVLNASTLELTAFSNTRVEGTIDCDRDGLLYTSIPQNDNWSVTVDGQEAEIKLVGDCMIAVDLTEGTHTITFTYQNAAFSLGWKISLGCLAVFVVLILVVYKPHLHKPAPRKKRGKGRYEK